MRVSSRWIDLGLVLIAVALGANWAASHATAPPDTRRSPFERTTLNGVCPGMTREEVLARLGPPGCEGSVKVVDGLGSYAEYGSTCLTWDGRPTITYHPDGRVLAVVGSELRIKGSRRPLRMGEPAVAGARADRVDTGTLTVTAARSGVVSRMVLSETR